MTPIDLSPATLNAHGLHRVGVTENAQVHVVFVHGLGGKGYSTWAKKADSPQTFWPAWVAEDFVHAQVWTYGYDAEPSWFTGDPMPVFDRAHNLRSSLQAQGLLEKPLVFVAHSLGGLVAKKLVVECTKDAPLKGLGGVLFLATPHHGAELALFAKWINRILPLRLSVLMDELIASHPAARELHTDYLRLERRQGFASWCAVEKKRTVFGFKVVSDVSTHPGDPSWTWRPCDENHFGIAKPSSRLGDLYVWYRSSVQTLIEKALSSKEYPVAVLSDMALYAPQSQPLLQPEQSALAPRRINIPPSIGTRFVGRDTELQALHDALQAHGGQDVALSSHALHGMGGYGKTRLVVEYAHRFGDAYACVLLLNAESPQSLDADLAALCLPQRLDLGGAHGLPKAQAERVDMAKRWLVQHTGWLLIADNADTADAAQAVADLARDCPQGQVLVTTRLADWGSSFAALPLQGLRPAAAKQLLLAQSAPGRQFNAAQDEADLAAIVAALHGHSLALSVAAAYVNQRRISFGHYLQDSRAQGQQPLHWLPKSALTGYGKSVAACLQMSVDATSPAARQLLDTLAWLAPEPLPSILLNTSCDGVPDVRDALAELEHHHLVEAGDGGPYIHRLLLEVLRQLETDAASSATNHTVLLPRRLAALMWVNAAFQVNPNDLNEWPVFLPLLPHVDVLLGALSHLSESQIAALPCSDAVARLCNQSGLLFFTRSKFALAEPLYRRALAITESTFGLHDPRLATCVNNLAALLAATNRLIEAEHLYQRALSILEASCGGDHPETATGLNNLAHLLSDTNRQAEAEPLFRRALAVNEARYGDKHPRFAVGLNNLAAVLESTDRPGEAEHLYRRALEINVAIFGEKHHVSATNLNNLAHLLSATNRIAEAEALYRRALEIHESINEESHHEVARVLNNLAHLLFVSDRMPEAEPLYRRALAINEATFGEDHPLVAISLNNFAELLCASRRFTEAESISRRHLAIFVRFTLRNGRAYPKLHEATRNYFDLLIEMQLSRSVVAGKLHAVLAPLQADPRFHDLALSLLPPTE